jgi:uncharacterized LabA/DUF88 family protein
MVERTAALLDEQYLLYGARAQGGRFDYRGALDWIRARYQLERAVVFALAPTPGSSKKWFLHKLRDLGYDVQTRQAKVFKCAIPERVTCPNCQHVTERTRDKRDGDMDIHIAMEAIRLAHAREVDHLLLVSGDLHFVPLIHLLRERYAVSTSVLAFRQNASKELQEVARAFHPVGPDLLKLAAPDLVPQGSVPIPVTVDPGGRATVQVA